jgi:NDP-4-keto-2,6-dideoxyhexose 3-C-methyltransferase
MKCRVCDFEPLSEILSLGDQYLSDFRDDDKKPPKFPLDLVLCDNCKLLQFKETTPHELLYTDHYGYRSGINDTIQADLKDIVANATAMVEVGDGDYVIDIGANDGTLLADYPKGPVRVGYEPVTKLAKVAEKKADKVFNDYFAAKHFQEFAKGGQAKIITAISMFYDLEHPNEFTADLKACLAPGGLLVIQQNYLGTMLQQNAFDNICHEHVEYYGLGSMEFLFKKHGMDIFKVSENNINGGSLRTYIGHAGERPIDQSVEKLRQWEAKQGLDKKETYEEFGARIKRLCKELRDTVSKLVAEGKTVMAYGASTRGNTILQAADLDKSLIKAALERNPDKYGKKIASTGIPIISEADGRAQNPDYLLVLPWFFKEEFLKREKAFLDAGGHFIFPLPELEIV